MLKICFPVQVGPELARLPSNGTRKSLFLFTYPRLLCAGRPCTELLREQALVNPWSATEKSAYMDKFIQVIHESLSCT